MALQYRIEEGVVVLSATAGAFAMLRDVLSAATADPAARPNMPLLIDIRRGQAFHYEDASWRGLILAEMRESLGSRWASSPKKEDALAWLRERP